MENERLQKLLYYTTADCLEKPALNDDQMIEMFQNNVKIVPKLIVDGSVRNYVIVSCDNFTPTDNPEFRDNLIEFDIICHFDQWQLKDFSLRPYKIAAEIDTMLDKQRLSGIGKIEFVGASQMVLTDEFGGICLIYRAYHGGEDKKDAPTKQENQDIINNFNKMLDQ